MINSTVEPKLVAMAHGVIGFVENIDHSVSLYTVSKLSSIWDLDPMTTPKKYGQLIATACNIPVLLSTVFFLLAGRTIKN